MSFETVCILSKFPIGPVDTATPGPILPSDEIAPVKPTAVFCSSIIGNYLLTSKGKDYETIPSRDIIQTKGSVVAFKQGNTELRDKVQNALYELNREGKLEEISNKWFGKNMVIIGEE